MSPRLSSVPISPNIKHYTEFQVSPQGEWVDLDIDRSTDPPNHNVGWNSGYKVKARIDQAKKIWYGEMTHSIGEDRSTAGDERQLHADQLLSNSGARRLWWRWATA
jgi:UDP-glucose 4-epimerase